MTDVFSHPAAVMARLADLDIELAERQNDYEDAAKDKAKLTRDWDYRLAVATAHAKGNDANARKAAALVAAAGHEDRLYERLAEAEAKYAAAHAAIRTREARVSIGQSILKAQGRA